MVRSRSAEPKAFHQSAAGEGASLTATPVGVASPFMAKPEAVVAVGGV